MKSSYPSKTKSGHLSAKNRLKATNKNRIAVPKKISAIQIFSIYNSKAYQTLARKAEKHKKVKFSKIAFACLTLCALIFIACAISVLLIALPKIKQLNYFNNQFHDVFQNSSRGPGREGFAQPNYNFSDIYNPQGNQYDNAFLHVHQMSENTPQNWGKTPPSGSRKFDYFYAIMQMEKYTFQLMPKYISQIGFNKQKLIDNTPKQYLNSLPLQLLLHKGTVAPGQVKNARKQGSSGFYVKETPSKGTQELDVNNKNNYADTTYHPSGFLPDSIYLIKKFTNIFSRDPSVTYPVTTGVVSNAPTSTLQNFNNLFSSGGKSNYYSQNIKNAGSGFKTGNLYRTGNKNQSSPELIGWPDKGWTGGSNITTDGFLLHALSTFSTDYAFSVQNYFLKPIKNEIRGVYKNGMANMIQSHKVTMQNLLWLFYNRIVINLASTLFRQGLFAPMLFTEGRNLNQNPFTDKNYRYQPIVPADNSSVQSDHSKNVFFESHRNNYIQPVENDKVNDPKITSLPGPARWLVQKAMPTARKVYSKLFVDGSAPLKIPALLKLYGVNLDFLPRYRVLPLFKHGADVVIICEILDSLNYIMFTQAEQIMFPWVHHNNVEHSWKVLEEAEKAFSYYFSTFTDISQTPETVGGVRTESESFDQARGDFYCAADLFNPAVSEVADNDSQGKMIRKPLTTTQYTDSTGRYQNYLYYLCKNAPDLLHAKINGQVVWTSQKDQNIFQTLCTNMYEFNPNAEQDVVELKEWLKTQNLFSRYQEIFPVATQYPGTSYFQKITNWFSADSTVFKW